MASNPITSGQREGEKIEAVTDFLFLVSKITVDSQCSHKIKRHMLPERKAVTNLDSMFKSRNITLLTKVHRVKSMVFPGVMYGCESWTIKKAECWRIDAFELQSRRRLLRVLWLQADQPWIFIERADAKAETPILWPPDVNSQLIGKDPDAGKDWRQKEKRTTDGWDRCWLSGHEFELMDRKAWCAAVHEWLNWLTGL